MFFYCSLNSHILKRSFLSFPVATVGTGSQKKLGKGRSRGLGAGGVGKALWLSSAVPPLAPGPFDGSPIMGLTGCSSRRPGRHPQQHVQGNQLSLSFDLHRVACR